MTKRMFWFALGAGLAVWGVSKARRSLESGSPRALGHRVAASAAGVGESARDFTDRVRAAMAEREAELRDAIGLPDPE